jgi:hypothetical protein
MIAELPLFFFSQFTDQKYPNCAHKTPGLHHMSSSGRMSPVSGFAFHHDMRNRGENVNCHDEPTGSVNEVTDGLEDSG